MSKLPQVNKALSIDEDKSHNKKKMNKKSSFHPNISDYIQHFTKRIFSMKMFRNGNKRISPTVSNLDAENKNVSCQYSNKHVLYSNKQILPETEGTTTKSII